MKHFIIVKFNDLVDSSKVLKDVKELFNQALNIDGVEDIKVYSSNTNLSNRHDLMIEMKLNKEALQVFDSSEIHRKWKEKYGKYIIDKTIFDCD